jgi:asparagine synthase (glutamine-hydrolysing)/putative beta-lactam synthetase
MREVLHVSMAGRLAVLLDRMDRMSAAAGLEVRLPFCDHELVEYVWNVPWTLKTHQGMKGLLKAAMRDIVPASTLDRKKSAYPHIQDSHYDRLQLQVAIAIASDPGARTRDLFDSARLREFLQQLQGQEGGAKRHSHLLVQLIELEKWLRHHEVAVH